MWKRTKKAGESYQEYIYTVCEIAAQGGLDRTSTIQYIVDGIEDEPFSKMILYGATTISELKQKFTFYEAMKEELRKKSKTPKVHKSKETEELPRGSSTRIGGGCCCNCGESGHRRRECPFRTKSVKCCRCDEFGHVSKDCQKNIKPQETPKQVCSVSKEAEEKCVKEVQLGDSSVTALIDTGSDLSLITADQYFKIGAPKLGKEILRFRGVGSDLNSTYGEIEATVTIDKMVYPIRLHVVSGALLGYDLLIGNVFLRKVSVVIDAGLVSIRDTKESPVTNDDVHEIFKMDVINERNEIDLSYVANERHRGKIETLITNYRPEEVRETGLEKNIVLKDEEPVYACLRGLLPKERDEVDTNRRGVQSFFGPTGYFRKFVPRYSVIARPLFDLLRKEIEFKFGRAEEESFKKIKEILCSKPVLRLYRVNAETGLYTDASGKGCGVILMQRDDTDDMFHPVYYASGKTTTAEEKYPSYELEVLAIIKSLRKFRVYLLEIDFKIVTDCRAFTLTMRKRDYCFEGIRNIAEKVVRNCDKWKAWLDEIDRGAIPNTKKIPGCYFVSSNHGFEKM
ncbi:uncharacterized protein LOC122518925 isoform X2 [Polistes fuscatus]|uniref:uncharacterized protein LOC122518925 isoform X2 n=1 Tax=Polistes fuscatus TaxID=30207 RepID=UPI001CA81F8B|nr:uncharacterized protein LOC122518925 isoform X2 [Polistes fuscatus]